MTRSDFLKMPVLAWLSSASKPLSTSFLRVRMEDAYNPDGSSMFVPKELSKPGKEVILRTILISVVIPERRAVALADSYAVYSICAADWPKVMDAIKRMQEI